MRNVHGEDRDGCGVPSRSGHGKMGQVTLTTDNGPCLDLKPFFSPPSYPGTHRLPFACKGSLASIIFPNSMQGPSIISMDKITVPLQMVSTCQRPTNHIDQLHHAL